MRKSPYLALTREETNLPSRVATCKVRMVRISSRNAWRIKSAIHFLSKRTSFNRKSCLLIPFSISVVFSAVLFSCCGTGGLLSSLTEADLPLPAGSDISNAPFDSCLCSTGRWSFSPSGSTSSSFPSVRESDLFLRAPFRSPAPELLEPNIVAPSNTRYEARRIACLWPL